MATAVIMPKFEMAQETGTVSRWLKEADSAVEKGEALLEVETDKVTMEVESPAGGILVGITAGPGQVVPVGQPIAHIIQPGEEWSPENEAGGADQPAAAEASRETPTAPPDSFGGTTPLAERVAASHEIDVRAVPGTGVGGRVTRKDVEAYLAGGQPQQPALSPGRVKAVPAARRLARELDVALETISGTGPGGRIQSTDVRQAAEAQPQAAPAPVDGRPAVRREVPLTGMRRTIAERMVASVQQAPQFTLSMDVDMGRALAIVDDLQATAAPDAPRVTLTTFLVKVCAWTLRRHPAVNAAFEEDRIIEWDEVNVGVAVAVEEGLVVPVIHRADALEIRQLAGQLVDLAARARQGQLRPADVRGGTFTLSNLGMFGVDTFTAILNPPQAAILAVGRVAKRALVSEDDTVLVRPVATFTLTADHRVVDGAQAGRFLADLRNAVERPGVLL